MKTKTFDCVAMKHRGARIIQEQIKGMSLDEQIEFWRRGTKEVLKIQRAAKEKLRPSSQD